MYSFPRYHERSVLYFLLLEDEMWETCLESLDRFPHESYQRMKDEWELDEQEKGRVSVSLIENIQMLFHMEKQCMIGDSGEESEGHTVGC